MTTEQKIVLVTGCNGGIGKGICRKFKEEGWNVIGSDFFEFENEFVNTFFKCDLMISSDIEKLFEKVDATVTKLDCLVNNAGHQICKPFNETSVRDFKEVMDCNLIAPFHLSQLAYPALKQARGCIINIASVHATATSDKIMAYAASKAGLVGMTKNMAIEYSKHCIRVNSISPGAVDTMMLRSGLGRGHIVGEDVDQLVFKLGRKHLVGRVGQPNDIAELVYFLGDNSKSEFITGQNFVADGGASIVLSTEC